MTKFLFKHWRLLALSSAALTTSHFVSQSDTVPRFESLVKLFKVKAAEYERRNSNLSRLNQRQRRSLVYADVDDDEDDEEEDESTEKNNEETNEEGGSSREKRFREFASIEYEGEIFMTPVDFLESVVAERPRPRIGRRQLTDEMLQQILSRTPAKNKNSKRFFRNLEDSGLISYSEYLFLWVILTKPKTQFGIAFAMFDTDGNQLVDRNEFLVLGKVMSDKRMLRRTAMTQNSKGRETYFPSLRHLFKRLFINTKKKPSINISSIREVDLLEHHEPLDTTLLIHFFGKNGRGTLNYSEFHRFMENFQTEVLEIEFNEFSHGFKTISDLDFAEILLRYTDFDREEKKSILKKVKRTTGYHPDGINFEQFHQFFSFLNNLDEFNIAMRFHQLSNKPISQAEFQRAVKISTGSELDENLIGLVFRIFDADDDQHLSYDEFMAVMKDRLSRGYQTPESSDGTMTKIEQFKRCFRDHARDM